MAIGLTRFVGIKYLIKIFIPESEVAAQYHYNVSHHDTLATIFYIKEFASRVSFVSIAYY